MTCRTDIFLMDPELRSAPTSIQLLRLKLLRQQQFQENSCTGTHIFSIEVKSTHIPLTIKVPFGKNYKA